MDTINIECNYMGNENVPREEHFTLFRDLNKKGIKGKIKRSKVPYFTVNGEDIYDRIEKMCRFMGICVVRVPSIKQTQKLQMFLEWQGTKYKVVKCMSSNGQLLIKLQTSEKRDVHYNWGATENKKGKYRSNDYISFSVLMKEFIFKEQVKILFSDKKLIKVICQ